MGYPSQSQGFLLLGVDNANTAVAGTTTETQISQIIVPSRSVSQYIQLFASLHYKQDTSNCKSVFRLYIGNNAAFASNTNIASCTAIIGDTQLAQCGYGYSMVRKIVDADFAGNFNSDVYIHITAQHTTNDGGCTSTGMGVSAFGL
jgi:hypothetical protein